MIKTVAGDLEAKEQFSKLTFRFNDKYNGMHLTRLYSKLGFIMLEHVRLLHNPETLMNDS